MDIIDKANYLTAESKTKEGYKIKIASYRNYLDIDVIFENGHIVNTTTKLFKNGEIKNPFHKSVFGVGYFGVGKYKSRDNKAPSLAYKKWIAMMKRCYDKSTHLKNPHYKDCSVCEEWLNFQNFAKRFEENYNPETMKDWHLDKDILVKWNKVYSPETCCFVPFFINYLFTKNDESRGDLPIGVSFRKNRNHFRSYCRVFDKREYLGSFKDAESAFLAYKKRKEIHVKEVAEKYRHLLSNKCYEAMIKYKVEITD